MPKFILPLCLLAMCALAALAGCTSPQPTRDVPADADPLVKKYPHWLDAEALKPDAAAGKSIFFDKTFGAKMACVNCHSFDAGDTLSTDQDGLVRAGTSLWAAIQRTNIKDRDSYIAALGGNQCVSEWQGGPSEGLTAQELRDLNEFLASGGGKDHATGGNFDYKARTYTIPTALTGGDTTRGGEMVVKYCNACHDIEDTAKRFGMVKPKLKPASKATDRLKGLVERIRDHYDERGERNNRWMPGFSDQRLPEKDLLDILAWFEKK